MADYYAAEIYMSNYDWGQEKNVALWRSTVTDAANPYSDGRWRYILHDTEYSSSLYGKDVTDADANSLEMALEKHPLFAAALQNPEFRELFKTAIREIGSANFAPQTVNESLDEWAGLWRPFMPDYYARFAGSSRTWDATLRNIRNFYARRYDRIIPMVMDMLPEIAYPGE